MRRLAVSRIRMDRGEGGTGACGVLICGLASEEAEHRPKKERKKEREKRGGGG